MSLLLMRVEIIFNNRIIYLFVTDFGVVSHVATRMIIRGLNRT